MESTYLIDTNVLIYAYNLDSPYHVKCREIVENCMNGYVSSYIADKNLYEFMAVVTDKRRIEKPVGIEEVSEVIDSIENSQIDIIYSSHFSLLKTLELVKKYDIKRQDIFDFVLVGIMLDHNINKIFTLNEEDFSMIEEINIVNPINSNH